MTARLLLVYAVLSLGTGQTFPSAASSIRGRVLDAQAGAPLPRAEVSLYGEEGQATQSTWTDGEGKYEFRAVTPGRYSLTARKNGFRSVTYGERPPIRDKTLVEVRDEADVAGLDVVLQRTCAITGRVVDEFGEPVGRASVVVETRGKDDDGKPQRRFVGEALADDLGQFRIPWLEPGEYFVGAEPPELFLVGVVESIEDQEPAKYRPIYYPGTANPAAAEPVRLKPGQDVQVNIALRPRVRTARLSGIVVDEQGRPPKPGGSVVVGGFTLSARLLAYVPLRQDGTFTVPGLLPDRYSLTFQDYRTHEWGLSQATLSDGDLNGVVVRTSPGGTVSGRLVFEGADAPPAAKVDIDVYELGDDTSGISGLLKSVAEDGTFTLTPLFGRCLIRVREIPGWMLKAIIVNGRDVADSPMTFDGAQRISGATIVLTDRVTHVNATVRARDGQSVDDSYLVIYPDDAARWRAPKSRYRRERWVQDGSPVSFDALPPGDYFAFALTASAALKDTDESWHALVERMRSVATTFSLHEGETKNVVVQLVGLDGAPQAAVIPSQIDCGCR